MKLNLLIILFVSIIYGQNKRPEKIDLLESLHNKNIKIEYKSIISFSPGFNEIEKISMFLTNNYILQKTSFEAENQQVDENNSIIIIPETLKTNKYNQILIDLNTRKLIEYTREIYFLEDDYAVEENLPNMKWILLSEQKQIGDFLCEKAKTTFRGRTYEVWYTTEIPITYGPWKFNGLPGLMVEIKDTQGIYTWQLTSFTQNADIVIELNEIQEKNSKFEIISFKDFDEKIINKRKNDFLMISSRNENPNVKFSFDTYQDKEPINEWRTQTRWEF